MKKLNDILKDVEVLESLNDSNRLVGSLCIDSREAKEDAVFIATPGTQVDGFKFIPKAIELGAKVIVAERLPDELSDEVTYVLVPNARKATALMANNFFDHPDRELALVGVTGTNGKTSVTTLLFQLFGRLGFQRGLLSTVENRIDDEVIVSTHTTPDAIQLNALLRKMADEGCSHVFMEVSSHAIEQYRTYGLNYKIALFTNLTRDHLDYHGTFDNYLNAKRKLFDGLKKSAVAIGNADDKHMSVMLQNTVAKKVSYAVKAPADYKAKVMEQSLTGSVLQLNDIEFHTPLTGDFMVSNLCASYAVASELGVDNEELLAALSVMTGARGRFEIVRGDEGKVAIVDYAHTPDALDNVIRSILNLKEPSQQLITVVGCGGDRDKGKRPQMGGIAAHLSDKALFTSDNPRSEEPSQIIKDMEEGLNAVDAAKVLKIEDREEAIKVACALAQADDIVLVAGKGHETYQEIKGVKRDFDDKEILTKILVKNA